MKVSFKRVLGWSALVVFLLCSAVNASEPPEERDDALLIQILLDQKTFGPGYLDGKIGSFSKKAAFAYNRSLGRSPGDWEGLLAEARATVETVHAMAIVPRSVKDYVNAGLSYKKSEQALGGFMPYRSFGELMAERYHTSVAFLIHLNGKSKVYGAKPGDSLKVPNIEPFLIENLRMGRFHESLEGLSQRTLIVDTKQKILYVYGDVDTVVSQEVLQAAQVVATGGEAFVAEVGDANGTQFEQVVEQEEANYSAQKLIATFPITPGHERFIHRGTWKMRNCIELPQWRYDPSLLKTGKRGKESMQIPGGPNNPVGIIWAGLSKSGIGIHGTSSPETIGRSRSAGCIRLSNWDAARLPNLARPGCTVIIR